MYLDVSNAFKSTVKSRVITTKARLTFKNFFSDSSDLIIDKNISSEGIKLADYCFDSSEGKLIGTAASKELEVEIINKDNYDLADKEFDLELGVLTDRENKIYEYVPYGRYVVTSYEDLKSSNKYRIIANDIMCKLNPEFRQNKAFKPTYPITAKEYYRQLMESYGIEIEEQELTNGNFLIDNAIDFEGNTGRYVLGRLAELFGSFAKINRDNKCQMYLKTETDEVIELSQMNSVLEIDNRYGPVNVVTIGLSQVEGENVTLEDVDSMAANGETTIRIDDNPFLYTEELREKAITPLFNRLRGFTYIPVSFKYKALLYSDCGDAVQVRNKANGELVDTIIFNQDIVIPATRQSKIESLALTNTEQKYKYISQTKQFNTRTEILVDKQNQKIESIVSQIGDRTNKATSITQDLESLDFKVSNVTGVTNELYGTNTVVLNECMNGDLLEFRIYGNNSVFNTLKIGTFKVGQGRKLLSGNARIKVTGEEFDDNGDVIKTTETIHEFGKIGVLRQLGEVYDEFVIESNKARIIRRIGVTSEGELFERETPVIQDLGTWSIPLVKGRNTIEILNYSANMYVKWAIINDFSKLFATEVQLQSEIKLAEQNIELSVTKNVIENISDEYATKELVRTAIELSEEEITAQVNKKVGEDSIIASLNIAVKNKQGIIDINGNQVKITSDNFTLDEDGKITAKSGEIAGLQMKKITSQSYLYKDYNNGTYQSGIHIPSESDGSDIFLYAGYPRSGALANSNFSVALNGLVKAKWFQVNGESGFFFVDYDNGKRALSLSNDGIFFHLNNEKNAHAFVLNRNPSFGMNMIFYDYYGFLIYDGIHESQMAYIQRYAPEHNAKDYMIINMDVHIEGNSLHDGKPTNIFIRGYEVLTTASDERIKKNIVDSEIKALELINKIHHKSFEWNEEKAYKEGHVNCGYIAQELIKIDPNFVIYNDEFDTYQINTLYVLSTSTKAIQELDKKNRKKR